MSLRDSAEFLALAAIWGASFLFMRIAAPELGPWSLMLLRCAIGALTLLPVLLWRGLGRELLGNALPLFAVGVLNSAVPFVLLGYATLSLSAGVTSILNSLAPIFAAVVAWLWLGERLRRAQLVGLALGVGGVAILAGGGTDAGGEAGGSLARTLLPFAAGVGATVFYGIGANCARRFLADVHPLATATGSQLAASAALLVPGVLLWPGADGGGDGAVGTAAVADGAGPDASIWLAAIVLGVLCTGVAYLLFFRLIANVGATRTIAVTFVIPAFGIGWGALFLDERIALSTVLGAVVIVLGTALTTGALGARRPDAASTAAAAAEHASPPER